MDKFKDVLDEKAQAALATLSPQKAEKMLADLEAKGSEVRNPSAWVCKAISNAANDPGGAEDLIEPYKGILDEKALTALNSIERSQVEWILKSLKEKGDELRNPSSWVTRAAANLANERKGKGKGKDDWGGKGGWGGDDGWGGKGSGWGGGPYDSWGGKGGGGGKSWGGDAGWGGDGGWGSSGGDGGWEGGGKGGGGKMQAMMDMMGSWKGGKGGGW